MKNYLLLPAVLLAGALNSGATVLPPEKLLPDDTLVMVTVPDFAKAKEIYNQSPQSQLWRDPAMKAFKDKFVAKLKSEVITPLERELNVNFDDYTALPQGQLTFALTQNARQGKDELSPGWLLLVDTKNKSDQLKKNLADLKKKWVDAGKPIKTEKIRDVEFSILLISSNDLAKTLKKTFSGSEETPEAVEEPATKKALPKTEIYIGQAESLLIVGNSAKAIERILVRMSGGPAPTLGELAIYEANHTALFRDAPFFGWINTKALWEILTRELAAKDGESQGGFLAMRPEKIIAATGLSALKTVAFSLRDSPEGSLFHVFLSAPETTRQGLLKILAGEAKETNPPPFVPADAVKFQRWRMDAQKTWGTLEKMVTEISPQALGTLNFLLDTASAAAKEKDPDFDLKKSLLGNLGDDLISYSKKPRGNSSKDLNSPPSLFLLGSPHPEQLASALKNILVLTSQRGGAPVEREFLGRKIFSITLPSLPTPDGSKSAPRVLNYSASAGYVAISTDASILEEYLRSSENQGKSLRETPGLADATQKVAGAGTSWFGFENQTETMRVTFEALKNNSGGVTNLANLASLSGVFGAPGAETKFKDWVDVSLLPGFDKIAKYFHFTVYAASASVDGLSIKLFAPAPPGLKNDSSKR